jgi:hypothetical protein
MMHHTRAHVWSGTGEPSTTLHPGEQIDHDEAEQAALRAHYSARPGPPLPERDPLAEGLLRGFWAHRSGRTA